MASARHSVLALLGLAVSIRALPAGLQDRQILAPPKQSVTWDSGNPQPTPEEFEAVGLPPVFPPKPSDQISLGSASYTVTWDGEGPTQTLTEPEKPTLPPPGPRPSDQISLRTPSYWVSWDTDSSVRTPAPEVPDYPLGLPKDQFSIGKPSYWISSENEGPEPTPAPEVPDYLAPGQPTDQFSILTPSYWVSWSGESPKYPELEPVKSSSVVAPPKSSEKPEPPKSSVRPEPLKSSIKPSVPASSSVEEPATTTKSEYPEYPSYKPWPPESKSIKSSTPKVSSTPDPSSTSEATLSPSPTPTPEPTPPKQSDQISLGTPSGWVSWDLANQKRQDQIDFSLNDAYPVFVPKATPKPISSKPKASSKKPKTSSQKVKTSSTPKPTPSPSTTNDYEPPKQSDEITIGPPRVSVSWGKREAVPQTEVIPPSPWSTQSNVIDNSNPSITVDWNKRAAEPQVDTIGLEFPRQTVWWPTPSAVKPPYISWGKRQDEAEPTDVPELPEEPEWPAEPENPESPIEISLFPMPTLPNSIGITPPKATVIWGKREAEPQVDTIGLQFPTVRSIIWDTPAPTKQPVYVSWDKLQYEAEPTPAPGIPDDEFPGDSEPEDPEGPIEIPPFPVPTLPNSFGIEPPKATVIWGKREAEAQVDTISLQFPTSSIVWEKPAPTNKPPVYVLGDKRQDVGLPTDILAPTSTDEKTIENPQATVTWSKEKRETDAESVAPWRSASKSGRMRRRL